MTLAVPLTGFAAALAVTALVVRREPSAVVTAMFPPDRPARVRRTRRGGASRAGDGELPLLLDLLASATAAGMSGPVAFGAAATALRGSLGDPLRAVAAATALGAPLAVGIRDAATRLGLPDLSRAAAILERSGSLGVPVSVALRELAAEHRRARRRAAEQRARTAPVRMLFPLVFLILPAFLLLTVVPMLIATVGSLS